MRQGIGASDFPALGSMGTCKGKADALGLPDNNDAVPIEIAVLTDQAVACMCA